MIVMSKDEADLTVNHSEVAGVGVLAKMSAMAEKERVAALMKQLSASIFFGISSVLIVMVNKLVLTTYELVTTILLGH